MKNNALENSRMSPEEFIKAIPVLIIAISSICFILGLIIVNVRLAEYGVYSSEFVRADYILVGGMFIILVLITAITLYYAVPIRLCKILWKRKKYVLVVFRILAGMFLSVFMVHMTLMLVTMLELSKHKGDLWESILLLYGMVLAISPVYKIMAGSYQGRKLIVSEILNKDGEKIGKSEFVKEMRNENFMPFAFATVLILTMMCLYSLVTYKYINSSFGGGDKNSVYLSPSIEGLNVSKAFSLPLNENATLVGPLEVLIETDKEIIILIPSEVTGTKVAIRMNKNLFFAIQAISTVSNQSTGWKWPGNLYF